MAAKTFKKVSVKQFDMTPFKKSKEGLVYEGIYRGLNKKPFQAVEDGEIKDKEYISILLDSDTGERTAYPCDGGLRQQIELAQIKDGDLIRAVWLEKLPTGKGRTMNQWDLLVAE